MKIIKDDVIRWLHLRVMVLAFTLVIAMTGKSFVSMASATPAQDEAGEYDPTPPPEPSNQDEFLKITLIANPANAGFFDNKAEVLVKDGSIQHFRAYNNEGWEFVNWTIGGKEISKEREVEYRVEGHDETLTANFVYNPETPQEPDVTPVSYPVTLCSEPAGKCDFYPSWDFRLKDGESRDIYFYPNTGFRLLGVTVNGERRDASEGYVSVTMQGMPVKVIASLDYDPTPPANPAANFFDPATGEMIVDDFKPGDLYSAAGVLTDYDFSKVHSLTVKGVMNESDIFALNYFDNAEIIDLSRTYGWSRLPDWSICGLNISTLVLPQCVTAFGGYLFRDCSLLSSLIIYASVPPEVSDYSFEYLTLKENLTIFVPAESIVLYQDADIWKDFMILPIKADVHALEVRLPEECADGRYRNGSIELRNDRSGMTQKLLVSDRLIYVFNSLLKDESYSVRLLSSSGRELGGMEGIVIGDDDISVELSDLSTLGTAVAKVVTPDGMDVTEHASIEWFIGDADGNFSFAGHGETLRDVAVGDLLQCRVSLDEQLGVTYLIPDVKELTAVDDNTMFEVRLTAIPSATLSGTVKDADGNRIMSASVSIMQTLNEKWRKTVSTRTGRDGKWTADVAGVAGLVVNVSAADFVSYNDTVSASGISSLDLGDVRLRPVSGTMVRYSFTFREAGKETSDYYGDYMNVDLSVRNLTQNCDYKDISTQYPLLVILDEGINPGDELEITASSRTGAFATQSVKTNVGDDNRAEVQINILGKGGVKAEYGSSANRSVSGMLYGENGEFIRKEMFSGNRLNLMGLDEGNYTLVAMGESVMMNSILRLDGFEEAGLEKGVDYIPVAVNVTPGEFTNVSLGEIPMLDEGKFAYTASEGTAFNFNKSEVTTGNYLTLSAKVDFKPAYKESVGNVALLIDLPEGCEIVENSVIQGPNLLPYTIDGGRLTIQTGDYYMSQVRFCVMPTQGGDLTASATVAFDNNGVRLVQPLGSASAMVKDLELCVPSVVAGEEFTASGMAVPNSEVKIYEGNHILGSGKSNGAGSYSVKCHLSDPYNLSRHTVFAEIKTVSGAKLLSETKTIEYDINALQVSKVTMYHWNPEMRTTYEAVFDFMNPDTAPKQWTVYYPDKKFTYTVEFTANDTTRISNVVLYVHTADRNVVPLYPVFDKEKSLWVADIDMGNNSDGYYPVNVSVDFDAQTEALVDAKEISDTYNSITISREDLDLLADEINKSDGEIEAYIQNGWSDDVSISELLEHSRILSGAGEGLGDDDIEKMSEDEVFAYFESLYNDTQKLLADSSFDYIDEAFRASLMDISNEMKGVRVAEYDGMSHDELVEAGYTEIKQTDSNNIYILATETEYHIINTAENLHVIVDLTVDTKLAQLCRLPSKEDFVTAMTEYIQQTEAYWSEIQNSFSRIAGLVEDVIGSVVDMYQANLKMLRRYDYAIEWLENQPYKNEKKWVEYMNKWVKERNKLNKRIACNVKIQSWLSKNISPNGLRVGKIGGGIFAIVDVGLVVISAINDFKSIIELYSSIPDPCKDDQEKANNIRNKIRNTGIGAGVYYIAQLASDIIQIASMFAGVSAIVPSGGSSIALVAGSITLAVANFLACKGYEKAFKWRITNHYKEAKSLKCLKDCGEPGKPECPKDPFEDEDNGNNGKNKTGIGGVGGDYLSGSPNNSVKIDPSGFVYEAVPSNRVQGVEATIFYKETKEDIYGDPYEEVVLWNAEEYAQKNPLFTDENGMYRWDVPQGMWQVKFEKDGYETTFSEWLPVPPPQLEVNIPIVQNSQPEVVDARAYETGVEIAFSKYMESSSLNTATIFVTASGEKVKGEVIAVDAEVSDPFAAEGIVSDASSYVSRLRFIPETPLSMAQGEICLTVSKDVMSYSGVPMASAYSQTLDIEKEVMDIVADEVEVVYGTETDVTIHVLPFDSAPGKTLHVESSSPMIASVDKTDLTVDEDGKCVVRVKGELPGKVSLLFSMEGVSVVGETAVNVVKELSGIPAPEASRASGSELYHGTEIVLTTSAEDGIIYYTLDGSCPCDESGSRKVYINPIVVDRDVEILAMTQVGEDNSEVVGFYYKVKNTSVSYILKEGWNWVSAPVAGDNASSWLENDEVDALRSGREEARRDTDGKVVDNVGALSAAVSYKVEVSSSVKVSKSGTAVNPSQPLAVRTGWNRLGYTLDQTMTLAEAFATTNVEPFDAVVGQNGFAQYDGASWVGTLSTLSPGLGYAYVSRGNKNIVYNTAVVSKAASRYAPGLRAASKYVVDVNRYPDIMCVIAELHDEYDAPVDAGDVQLLAFCGSECRGVATVVDGMAFMTVYGNAGDKITFKGVASDKETAGQTVVMSETLLGDMSDPYVVLLDGGSGVDGISYSGKVSVRVERKWLFVDGVDCDEVECVSIYDIDGRKVVQINEITEEGVSVADVPDGAYVVAVETRGGFSYHKVMVR